MKTFFLALILGIFVGSIITNYFADPKAYENLKEAKAQLFEKDAIEETEPSRPEVDSSDETAHFEVGGGSLEDSEKNAEPISEPIPLPKPTPEEMSPAEEAANAPPEPSEIHPQPPESPIPDTEAEAEEASEPEADIETEVEPRSEKLIEEGTQKADEIVDAVAEKAKEVAENAKPMIGEGIDMTIAAGIRAQYKLEEDIDSAAIEISVKDNIVTLSGTVDSEKTKQRVIEIAVFTKGVDGVEESLSIVE
ncbi:BON domain-containing protein [Pelagicoccus sp. SDUM812002]|uniref:BON domain-containing protein n=1 Tax=Pelagicoccus sp. SDUM812002 TaxID=3041266 RepID=UPI00280E6D04|nr:BON domain-containing protein [Pelagicoccus sp. SDUM812002]MDQ8186063.1 BON domain-containing protein [Pelagicoccus sp. SDUM812002]